MSSTASALPYSSEILEREGKGFETHDIFNYKPFGEFLQNLLDNTDEPHTVAIHGAWGSGKTVFVEMWKEHMEEKGFSVIYFDAFKHDYQSNVFLSLTKTLYAHFKDKDTKDFKGKAKKILEILSKNIANSITKGIIDEKVFNAVFNSCERDKKDFDAFKEALLNLIKKNDKNNKPLIFIIDEMDRCRPDFALEILEKVKHVFNIPNLHFIFAVNLITLENSVQKIYGVDRQYLQKFFKFSLALPKNTKELPFYEENYFLEKTNSYIFYFFKKIENEQTLHFNYADKFIEFYRIFVLIKNKNNEPFTIRDFQRMHDYFLFGARCLTKDDINFTENLKYFLLLQYYLISIEKSNLFNKLRNIICSTRNDYESTIKLITKEELSYLSSIDMGIGKDFSDFRQNPNVKIVWETIDNMKYLVFSESSSPPSDRN